MWKGKHQHRKKKNAQYVFFLKEGVFECALNKRKVQKNDQGGGNI
jgi:hypothetical protein